MRPRARPSAWEEDIAEAQVDVLPVIDGEDSGYPGWCSYAEQLESPDVEILCGGTNSKNPRAAAIWRQGHLMHFGFEPSPLDLNDNGRALLLNSIAYIAKFHQDQALVRQPSPFAGTAPNGRSSRAADEKFLGIDIDDPGFFDRCRDKLAGPEEDATRTVAILARSIARRGEALDARGWSSWIEKHREALFFTRSGGERWLVDRLAQARGIPSAELRGPDRADIATRSGSR